MTKTLCLSELVSPLQSLLQLTRDRRHEFEDLTRSHGIVAATLNEADHVTFEERYTVLKNKYNHLLDTLTQRVNALDEASRKFQLIQHIL